LYTTLEILKHKISNKDFGLLQNSLFKKLENQMINNLESTWETYTSSWKAETSEKKRAIFEECLDPKCEYNDPHEKTKSWDELVDYMLGFHEQVPGGHFVTKYFMAHNNQSIAKWDMKNGEHIVIGEGISYGKYHENGKLISMTGFFETP